MFVTRTRRARRWMALLAGLAVLLAPVIGSVPSAAAATITWSVAPATGEAADGRISLRHTVDPGGSVEDAIAVTNTSEVAAEFAVATGAGIVGDGGAFDLAPGEPTGAGQWITVQGVKDGSLTLKPGETRVLPVRIAVPAEATPGDHPAGIVVGVSQGEQVTVTHRVGVRIHLRVAGELQPALELSEVASSYEPAWAPFLPGTLSVSYRVTNTGNVRLGATPGLAVSGPLDLFGVDAAGQPVAELLPGDVATGTVTTQAHPLFVLFGHLTVNPTRVGADELDLPAATGTGFSQTAVSWTGLAAVGLVALLVVVALRQRRRRLRNTAP